MANSALPPATESATSDSEENLPLTAYRLTDVGKVPIKKASASRAWMDKTPFRFANRCLPLLIANSAGWMLLSPHKVSVTWGGDDARDSLKIDYATRPEARFAVSLFGCGILTWTLPYLFRTPPGYNLLARGPSNMPKDGIYPLEGIVETDWADASFTMNWKLTRSHHTVTFDAGEPICMIVPQARGELEIFQPEIRDIESDPELAKRYDRWLEERERSNRTRANQEWQKDYFRGGGTADREMGPARSSSTEHQTKIELREFVELDHPTK
jgi:hypothetical protein